MGVRNVVSFSILVLLVARGVSIAH